MSPAKEIQLTDRESLLMKNLNTGIRYNDLDAMKSLKDGEMYLGMFHGRTWPDEVLNDWGTDGFVFGPISKLIVEDFNKISIVDMEGNIIPLPVVDDMICADGKPYDKIEQCYYGDMTVFMQGVEIPLHMDEQYPVVESSYTGEVSKKLVPAIYIDGQNTKEGSLHRSLIGPVTAAHTTYLYHIRIAVNHISHEWAELNFNDSSLVDGKFNRVEYFVVK